MELNSALFILFTCAVCLVAYLVPRKVRYIWLLVCSYAFYLYNADGFAKNLWALGILAGVTLLSYGFAFAIAGFKKLAVKRVFLVVSLLCSLAPLMFFKYYSFPEMANVAQSAKATGSVLPWLSLAVPLGVFFYTLQAASYTANVYKGKIEPVKNPLLYALYVGFFPSIVTGPINRIGEMLPQFREPARFSYKRVSGGLFRIVWGYFKRQVIAGNLALFTGKVLSSPGRYSGPELVLAMLLFAYQFYAEFSGLIDIAAGSARMLGFDVREDFKVPFGAKTFWELWRRWQASFTSFLRDYVYIPLGGNKVSLFRKLVTIFFVLLLGAAWYGVGHRYLIWGAACGLLAVFGKALYERKEKLVSHIPVYRNRFVRGFFSRFFVYLLFAAASALFAAAVYNASLVETMTGIFAGWNMLTSGMFFFALTTANFPPSIWPVVGGGILMVCLVEGFGAREGSTVADWVRRRLFFIRWPLYILLLGGLLFWGVYSSQPSVIVTFIFEHFGPEAIEWLSKLFALLGITLPV